MTKRYKTIIHTDHLMLFEFMSRSWSRTKKKRKENQKKTRSNWIRKLNPEKRKRD